MDVVSGWGWPRLSSGAWLATGCLRWSCSLAGQCSLRGAEGDECCECCCLSIAGMAPPVSALGMPTFTKTATLFDSLNDEEFIILVIPGLVVIGVA